MQERIGQLQVIPTEEMNIGQKYALYVEWSMPSDFVKISNRDDSGKIIHEIKIEGTNGITSRALTALNRILKSMESTEKKMESEIIQAERPQRKRMQVEKLPEYGLIVRTSRYNAADIFFIIKGTEREDTATEPPFKIEVDGDYVSVSKENLRPLIEKLETI